MAVAGGFAAADGAVAIVGAGCAASGFVVAGSDAGCAASGFVVAGADAGSAASGFVVAGADAGCAVSGVVADTCFLGTAAPEGIAVVPASATVVLAVSLPAMAAIPLFAGAALLDPTCAAAGPVSEAVAGFGASVPGGECRVGNVCAVGVAEC